MSLRNMGLKKGGIIKNPKSSKNKYGAFTVEASSVTKEDSLGSSSSLSAPLMHSAEANALRLSLANFDVKMEKFCMRQDP